MPDWIIHMGVAHVLARPTRRWDLKWLMLGAVLPDAIPRVIGHGIDLLFDAVGPPEVYLYLSFLHTPFSVALLAAALVAVACDRGAAWRGLAFGAGLHFALDLMQRTFGGGMSLFYPFDVRAISLQVAWYDNPVTYGLVASFGLVLAVLLVRRRGAVDDPAFCPHPRRRIMLATALLAACSLTPLACMDAAYRINLHNSRLVADPAAFDGKLVEVSGATVHDVDERYVVIEIMDLALPVTRSRMPDVVPRDIVSLQGVYRGGQIEPEAVFVHDYVFKKAVSLIGALLLLAFWAPSLAAQWRVWRTRTVR